MLVTSDIDAYIPEIEKKYKMIDETFNSNFFEDDLGDLAKSLNIDYLGVERIFREAYEEKGVPLHWFHWNYNGHSVVADALFKKLVTILLKKSS